MNVEVLFPGLNNKGFLLNSFKIIPIGNTIPKNITDKMIVLLIMPKISVIFFQIMSKKEAMLLNRRQLRMKARVT